jgi:hypothetical protein
MFHFSFLPPLTLPYSLKCLDAIFLPPTKRRLQSFHTRSLKDAIAEEAVDHLAASPCSEATASLAIALFHPNESIAQRAETALAQKGQAILPSLIAILMHPTPPAFWNPKGAMRVLDLLRQYGDKRVSHTLIRVAQKELPVLPNRLLRHVFHTSLLLSSLLVFPLSIMLLLDPKEYDLNDFIPTLVRSLVSWGFVACILFISLFLCIAPLYTARERWLQGQFSRLALQALQAIPDKRMVPYLIRLTWNGTGFHNEQALKALRPLLPLVTPKDTSLFPSWLEESALINAIDRYDTELTLAILHVLECIGTGASLQKVYRTIKRHPNDTIGAQAKQTAEAIHIREAQKEQERTLLRASETPSHTHELLRPTEEDHDQEVLRKELLRPKEEG